MYSYISDRLWIDMTDTSEIFKSLAVDARRELLMAMVASDRTVQELTDVVSISQSAVSQHLATLKNAGLVRDRKVGRYRYYSLCPDAFQHIEDWLEPFRDAWLGKLDQLERHLERRKN
ncbi:MAG: metalloregulator ArsR/SmtB family transcription factor [Henriciella sp.]